MLQRSALRLHSLKEKTLSATGKSKANHSDPIVIGILGGSCSGKTTFYQYLVEALGEKNFIYLNENNYFQDAEHVENPTTYIENPQNIQFELLRNHLDDLLAGCSVHIPEYDFRKLRRTAVNLITQQAPIIILEGRFLATNPDIEKRLTRKIFIDADSQTLAERRILKEIQYFGKNPEYAKEVVTKIVMPTHQKFIEPLKPACEHIVKSGEYEKGASEILPILADYLQKGII